MAQSVWNGHGWRRWILIVDKRYDHTLLCGARPSGFAGVCGLHVKTIISLEAGWFELFHGQLGAEKRWARQAGVSFCDLRWSDFRCPSPWALNNFCKLATNALVCGDVYFHCKWGKDRTGMARAAWRIIQQGWHADKAIAELREEGFHSFPYEPWLETLRGLSWVP